MIEREAYENEMWFCKDTPPRLRALLLRLWQRHRKSVGCVGERMRFHYGDPKTGQLWGDVVVGYVGRSTGRVKIPLVVHNSRSYGGQGLLDDCILLVDEARKNRHGGRDVYYRHPNLKD